MHYHHDSKLAFERWQDLQKECPGASRAVDMAKITLHSFRAWPTPERYRHCGLWCGMTDGFSILYKMRQPRIYRAVRWLLVRTRPFSPTWNAYWMVMWKITKDQRCAAEIHQRAHHIIETGEEPDALHNLQFTAHWMMTSTAQRDPQFAEAIAQARKECKVCQLQDVVNKSGRANRRTGMICEQ